MARTQVSRVVVPFLISTLVLSCSGSDGAEAEDQDKQTVDTKPASYDAAKLEAFRQALPGQTRVAAVVPGAPADPDALTVRGNASLAKLAIDSAVSVNIPAQVMVILLQTIIMNPPTLYDSKKREFLWGPWNNDDGYGQFIAYIRENPKGDDFKYGYAMARIDGTDLATASPIIWGGSTPGKDADTGIGVTLWDFEANNQFDVTYNPDYDPATTPRDVGRFSMVYGKGEEANGDFAFNVAVFRKFIPKDAKPGTEPADLDYFFGHFAGDDGNVVDFVDWSMTTNLCNSDPASCFSEPDPGENEVLALRAAFINQGAGRGEVSIADGDLSSTVTGVECWDDAIARTALVLRSDDEELINDGACTGAFEKTLEELGVPTLADVDPDMLAKMDCVASNGPAACTD